MMKQEVIRQYDEAGSPEDQREKIEQMLYIVDALKTALPYLFIGQIISSIFTLLISGSLLYGVNNEKGAFMLPWLICHFMSLVVSYTDFSSKVPNSMIRLFSL